MVRNLSDQAFVSASLYGAEVDDTDAANSVDARTTDGLMSCIQVIGAVGGTNPSLTGKVQESDDNSTWTDAKKIDGTTAEFTAATAASGVQVVDFVRTKRYVRHFRTVSGTSPTFQLTALIYGVKKIA